MSLPPILMSSKDWKQGAWSVVSFSRKPTLFVSNTISQFLTTSPTVFAVSTVLLVPMVLSQCPCLSVKVSTFSLQVLFHQKTCVSEMLSLLSEWLKTMLRRRLSVRNSETLPRGRRSSNIRIWLKLWAPSNWKYRQVCSSQVKYKCCSDKTEQEKRHLSRCWQEFWSLTTRK